MSIRSPSAEVFKLIVKRNLTPFKVELTGKTPGTISSSVESGGAERMAAEVVFSCSGR